MNITPSLPFIRTLNPIIVTSPSIRCGTTLLQRLFCSASNALVYGENCGYELEFFLNTYVAKASFLRMQQDRLDSVLDSVMNGNVNDMIIDLMPGVEGQLEALEKSCFSLFAYYQEYAQKANRPVWGIKFPSLSINAVNLLRNFIPECRVVFIHRNLVDCLKSAKAWQGMSSEGEIQQFCNGWLGNMNYILAQTGDDSILTVNFKDLVTDSTKSIEKLAAFTGAEEIDPRVFEKKINTFQGNGQSSGADYIQPAELSDREMQIAQDTMKRLIAAEYPID